MDATATDAAGAAAGDTGEEEEESSSPPQPSPSSASSTCRSRPSTKEEAPTRRQHVPPPRGRWYFGDVPFAPLAMTTSMVRAMHDEGDDGEAPAPSRPPHPSPSGGRQEKRPHQRRRKNSELTEDERREKRALKMELRFRRRVHKIETRMRHARVRNDPVVERQAAAELERLLGEHGNCVNGDATCDSSTGADDGVIGEHDRIQRGRNSERRDFVSDGGPAPRCAAGGEVGGVGRRDGAKRFVMSICYHLFYARRMDEDEDEDDDDGCTSARENRGTNNRLEDHERATKLLRHMTKGTQTLSMFDGEDGASALRGYSRRKFLERAMLVCDSLLRLDDGGDGGGDSSSVSPLVPADAWTAISGTRRACSIGCGPGNDMVGLVGLLLQIRGSASGDEDIHPADPSSSPPATDVNGGGGDAATTKGLQPPTTPVLEEAAFLDWAVDDWRKAVLDPLVDLLVPRHVRRATTGFCDVTLPLTDPRNAAARRCCGAFDLFLISYLLTETRGKSVPFVLQLISEVRSGTAFYFAEPTPWQLHRLIEAVEAGAGGGGGGSNVAASHPGRVDFTWLDSSMHLPALQALNGRVGPAVLFAIKR